MRIGILGRKIGMTQVFDEKGAIVPVTVVDTSGCVISQVKSKSTDGYSALQLGFGEKKPQNVKKANVGHFKKAGVVAKAMTKEIRMDEADDMTQLKAGQTLGADMFAKGDIVDVLGVIKGKGFQGVMKRHGYKGKDATHGTHEYFRHGGSIGTNTFPGRVLKNKGMPGQTGNVPRTVQNLEIIDVKADDGILLVRGALPGPRSGVLVVRLAKKQKAALIAKRTFASAAPAEAPAA